jgi:hypothetical protein
LAGTNVNEMADLAAPSPSPAKRPHHPWLKLVALAVCAVVLLPVA